MPTYDPDAKKDEGLNFDDDDFDDEVEEPVIGELAGHAVRIPDPEPEPEEHDDPIGPDGLITTGLLRAIGDRVKADASLDEMWTNRILKFFDKWGVVLVKIRIEAFTQFLEHQVAGRAANALNSRRYREVKKGIQNYTPTAIAAKDNPDFHHAAILSRITNAVSVRQAQAMLKAFRD